MRRRVVNSWATRLSSGERGAVFIEAVVIVPAFIFLVMASIQLFVISWRLSQVQLEASDLARTLAIPVNNAYPCTQINTAAIAFGRSELGVIAEAPLTVQVMQRQQNGSYGLAAAPNNCPTASFDATERQTAVVTLTYQAPLFVAQIIPGGANFTYRGVAVAVLEKPRGGTSG